MRVVGLNAKLRNKLSYCAPLGGSCGADINEQVRNQWRANFIKKHCVRKLAALYCSHASQRDGLVIRVRLRQ